MNKILNDMEVNKKLPQTIDIDFVRSLRLSGQKETAKKLLDAFRQDVKNTGKRAFIEERSKQNKISRKKHGYYLNGEFFKRHIIINKDIKLELLVWITKKPPHWSSNL